MDLTHSYPNIISYEILNEYIQNKINFEYYNNIYLADNCHFKKNGDYMVNTNNDYDNEIYDENISNVYGIEDAEDDEDDKIIKNGKETIEDAWESAINDEKFYINNKIARIFPILKNFNNF